MGKPKAEGLGARSPSIEQSQSLQACYDYLNDELFEGKLPKAMLVLSRNSNILGGYYTPERWFSEDGTAVPEIAINANCLKQSSVVRAMVVLIHEMLHHWQQTFGKPSRPGYHNKEYADKAKSIGLQTVGPKGEEVGQTIDSKLISGERAEEVIADMPEHYTLPWMTEPMNLPGQDGGGGGGGGGQGSPAPGDHEPQPKKVGTRTKYTCPACGFNLWGKSGGHFECMDCHQVIIEMTGAAGEGGET